MRVLYTVETQFSTTDSIMEILDVKKAVHEGVFDNFMIQGLSFVKPGLNFDLDRQNHADGKTADKLSKEAILYFIRHLLNQTEFDNPILGSPFGDSRRKTDLLFASTDEENELVNKVVYVITKIQDELAKIE